MKMKQVMVMLSIAVILTAVLTTGVIFAATEGTLDPVTGPTDSGSQMYTLEQIYERLVTGAPGSKMTTFTEPATGPGATMQDLNAVMGAAPEINASGALTTEVAPGKLFWGLTAGEWGLQTGSAGVGSDVSGADGALSIPIASGFYTETKTATANDGNLLAENIRSGVNIFGVTGSLELGAIGSNVSGGEGEKTFTIPDGLYTGKTATANDGNLLAENIRSGVNIFGVTGSLELGAIGSNVSGGEGEKTFTIPDGLYTGKTATANDGDLLAENIKSGINIFGVDGTLVVGNTYDAGLAQTGQTDCYEEDGTEIACTDTGQDGDYQKGVAWPNPRFITGTTGVVTDTLTGLIWLEDANCTETVGGVIKSSEMLTWTNALEWSNKLADNHCGLGDGSIAGDWRLPNVRELHSLIDYGQFNPSLPSGHPFSNVVPDSSVWASTTDVDFPMYAWYVTLDFGYVDSDDKTSAFLAWPVRGGQ